MSGIINECGTWGTGGDDSSDENLLPPGDFGGGGVGARSWIDRLDWTEPAPAERRRRDVDCLRMRAFQSTLDALESEGYIMVRRTIAFAPEFVEDSASGRSRAGIVSKVDLRAFN